MMAQHALSEIWPMGAGPQEAPTCTDLGLLKPDFSMKLRSREATRFSPNCSALPKLPSAV